MSQNFKYQLRPLEKGDTVRIVCTARSAQKEQLKPAADFLESIRLKADYGNTIGKVHHQFGGTAQERLDDFVEAWNDPKVAAIWIARGGYGSIQILEGLDFRSGHFDSLRLRSGTTAQRPFLTKIKEVEHFDFAQRPRSRNLRVNDLTYIKPIIGYSDVTLIHNKMQKAGLPSIHAFMPLEVDTRSAFAKASLQKALFNEKIRVEIENSRNLPVQEINGKLYGGNLSILYSMLGSDDLPDFTGGILFIEEIDEYLYHIERMMYSLKRAGKLNELKALIVGGMTDMRDHKIPFGKTAHEIIQHVTENYDYPVIFDFPAGHVDNNVTLKMGVEMEVAILEKEIRFRQ